MQVFFVSCTKQDADDLKTAKDENDHATVTTNSGSTFAPNHSSPRAIVIFSTREAGDNFVVYGLDWSTNEIAKLGSIPSRFSRRFGRLQILPNGKMTYVIRDSLKNEYLVTSEKDSVVTLPAPPQKVMRGFGYSDGQFSLHCEERREVPDYALSPDGDTLIFCANLPIAIVDSAGGTLVQEIRMFALPFGDTAYRKGNKNFVLYRSF